MDQIIIMENKPMLCDSCDCMIINGIKCHELGCPDAWKDYKNNCLWCGIQYTPDTKDQQFCSIDCQEDYYQ